MREAQQSPDATRNGLVEWDTVPAFVVRNLAKWVNPFLKPFPVEMERETPLAMMLRFGDDRKTPLDMWLGKRKGHNRSADISAAYFKDPDGRIYRDIDGKGNGYIRRDSGRVSVWQTDPKEGDVVGLMDEKWAKHDAETAEAFTKLGIRSHRVLCVARLLELPVLQKDGTVKLVPIEEIPRGKPLAEREHNILPNEFVPAIQIRAFGTKTRLADVTPALGQYTPIIEPKDQERSRTAIEDAIQLVGREFPEVTDVESYARWFAKTLGKNVGIMHREGYVHGFLSMHNITLDCRLVDLDSVTHPDQTTNSGWGEYMKHVGNDMSLVRTSLTEFQNELFLLFRHEPLSTPHKSTWQYEMQKLFDSAYKTAYSGKEPSPEDADPFNQLKRT